MLGECEKSPGQRAFFPPQLPLKFVVKTGIYSRRNLSSRWNLIDACKPFILELYIESGAGRWISFEGKLQLNLVAWSVLIVIEHCYSSKFSNWLAFSRIIYIVVVVSSVSSRHCRSEV